MKIYSVLYLSILILASCKGGSKPETGAMASAKIVTPVSVIAPENIVLNEEITLNATSTYLLKAFVKASINGYIQSSSIKLGQSVAKGSTLFVLKTKEAQSLGNTINKLDPSFKFSGLNAVKSPVNGFITILNHQAGDYVQDGEQLAEIADQNSFGFLLNLPYEFHQLLAKNKIVTVHLPDGRNITGTVAQIMPSLDSITQTQQVLIKVNTKNNIPENLIATVSISKNSSTKSSLPKECVLADESQQDFWIMQMINASTAVKIPVKKGIESANRIEILSPQFNGSEKILITGNYGLADTALVKIKH